MKLAAALVLVLPFLVSAQDSVAIGTKIERLQAFDNAGNERTIVTSGKVTAVVFTSTQCPIAADYLERMAGLYREYTPKGVQFLFLNANANESEAEMEQHAKDHNLPFAVLRDRNNVIADLLKAQYTPESFVFDSKGVMSYHGGIDDSRNPARVTKHLLREALESVIAGKPVSQAESKAFGCTIKRAKKAS